MEAEIESGLTVVSAVVMPPENDIVQMVIRNESSFTHRLSQEETVGVIETEGVLDAPLDVESSGYLTINMVSGDSFEQRKEELLHSLTLPDLLQDELKQLEDFLVDHHNVFSLGNGERGETDIVKFEIDTGDVFPQNKLLEECPRLSNRW